MSKHIFHGVGVALITPFDKDGAVDFTALEAVVDYVTAAGADFLVVMGTTAENATLTKEEKHDILRTVVKRNKGKLPIVYGVGGNNTAETINTLKTSDLEGVDGILSVVPYYNKPNQEGIYAHFAEVLKNSQLPVILYNVPARTGVNMTATTTLKLANDFRGRAVAVKEASGNLSQAAYILKGRPEGFALLSGDDNLTLPLAALGADGVISVSANAFPSKFSQMVHKALEGDLRSAAPLNLELHSVTDMLFEEGNPAGVKAALSYKGLILNKLRLPLTPISKNLEEKIVQQILCHGLY
ncbi:4-hydroxy-tetrahydrodipicolinate synthase [Mucinivorans hirudinis]|uniref:4-hydroxy-tetrahydrodipicolinate synthase n=1 Tax=Mucinivorans hirudinis TaxID=1433126 RepID=A0A060R705_9BACT|nr:4-hydroxy-tetrahydrodipicolinate synthase [Mucinivorans hirudinis]